MSGPFMFYPEVTIDGVRVVNLTWHEVAILTPDLVPVLSIPAPEDKRLVPRLQEKVEVTGSLGKVPLVVKSFERSGVLPPPYKGVIYIVSLPIASAFPERRDLFVPDDLVRLDGRVLGATRLAQVEPPAA